MFAPDRYVSALELAARRHHAQLVPGSDLPYLVHVVSVAAEVIGALDGATLDGDLAVGCALLHDTIEDTASSVAEREALAAEITEKLGAAVTAGVWALTKDDTLPKAERMPDSLRRIREQPHAVWAVKLADRITNLSEPPHYWTSEKRAAYRAEAIVIAEALGEASPRLHARLRAKIETYAGYV